MKITKITLSNLDAEHMGAEATDADAAGYRAWITARLAEAYPDAEIVASDAASTYSVRVEVEDEADYESAMGEVSQLCEELWDRCPWGWVEASEVGA